MTSSPDKRRSLSKNDFGQDRLSEMPDEVLLHILSLMPTLDAVRTMLLRRFGDLWTLVASLRFDFDDYRHSLISNDQSVAFPCFVSFIRYVVMLHRGATIDTFHFNDSDIQLFDDPMMSADAQMWLRFATARNVKDLVLRYHCVDELAVPRCVLKSQVLVTLVLANCVLDPHHQVHMGALNKLSLTRVKGNNEAISQLISGCPSLQELVIDDVWGYQQNLNISSPSVSMLDLNVESSDYPRTLNVPNLKVLTCSVRPSPFQLDVINVSSLQEVTVKNLPTTYPRLLIVFLMKFQNAEVLTLSYEAFEELSCLKRLGFPQNRWKRLVLQPFWYFKRNLQVIFELVKSSVNVEELIIHAEDSSVDCEFLSSDNSTCVMPQLKTVGINAYGKLCEGHLQLVELLLRTAVVLEKLVITFGKNKVTTVEELSFVKQVSRFRRGSANATVDFICLDNIQLRI